MAVDLWWGTRGPRDAKIVVVGEAYGSEEDRLKQPFVGESGRELDKMLTEASIDPKTVFMTNLISERPKGNDILEFFYHKDEVKALKLEPTHGLYPRPNLTQGLARLYAQIDAIKPTLIIGCGNYPFWAFSSSVNISNSTDPSGWKIPTGISTWRGSQLVSDRGPGPYRFLPVLHPASILRNWPTRAITVHDLRVRVPLAFNSPWEKPSKNYIIPPSLRQCFDYLSRLDRKLSRGLVDLVIDLETKGNTIACIGLTSDGVTAIAIPFLQVTPDGVRSYWDFSAERALVRRLRAVLNHPNARLIGQNFLYDIQYMSKWWRIRPRCHWDTLITQHVLFPGTPKALGYLASLYNKTFFRFWKEDSKEWEVKGDLTTHLRYNCDDCFETWTIYQEQKNAVIAMDREPQRLWKMEEWLLAFELMDRGIRVAAKERADMSVRVMEAAAERQKLLNRMVPEWVRPVVKKGAKAWYSSAQQQMRLFYDEMGLKSVHHRKTGNLTVDDTALQEIKLRYPELTRLVDTIAELRSLGVFQNNFLSAAIDPDGRMRCSFNPAGTDTMRWSSSENAFGRGTNLQNIPKGDE